MGAHHHGQKPSSPGSTSLGCCFLPRASACTWLACAFLLSLSLLHLLFCSPHGGAQQAVLQFFNHTYSSFSAAGVEVAVRRSERCDYSVGRWVWAPGHARRYNGTVCGVKYSLSI